MISRLTILVAVINLSLSGYVIYSIFDIQKSVENYVPEKIVMKTSNNIDDTSGQEPTTIDDKDASETPDLDEIIEGSKPDQIVKYNLTEEELYSLLNSGNPFGTSLGSSSDSLKSKIDNEVEENRKLEESTNATNVDKEQIKEISELKSKKYDIPSEWITAIIEETSNYNKDLTSEENGIVRKGIMQIREDKLAFISESIGAYYQPDLEFNVDTNIDMGAYYLSYLSNQNSDEHYAFTAYFLGPKETKDLFESTGSYRSDFSEKIINKLKEL